MESKKNRPKKKALYWLSVIVVGITLGLTLQFASAWVGPPANPPSANVGAPINTAPVDQTKGNTTSGKINAQDFCLNSDPAKCLSTSAGERPISNPNCQCVVTWDSCWRYGMYGAAATKWKKCTWNGGITWSGWSQSGGLCIIAINQWSDLNFSSSTYPCYND